MQSSTEKPKSLAIVVLAGCGLFFAGFLYAAHRIFLAFQGTGIPVRSGNKIVTTLDPLATVLVAVLLAALVAFLVVQRTLRLMRSGKKAGQ